MVNTRGSVNPWSSNDTLLGIQLGDPQSGLVLARRHGLLPHCGLEDSYSDYSRHVLSVASDCHVTRMCLAKIEGQRVVLEPDPFARAKGLVPRLTNEQGTTDSRVEKSSSLRMIELLQEMSRTSEELSQIEQEVHKRLLDREMVDFTHVAVLESKLQRVDSLLDHLTAVVTGKDLLLKRLQSRATENSLKIEAPFQKHTSEVLSLVGPALSELPSHCDRLQWANSFDMQTTSVEEKSAKGVESLLQCKAAYKRCQHLHNTQSKMCTRT